MSKSEQRLVDHGMSAVVNGSATPPITAFINATRRRELEAAEATRPHPRRNRLVPSILRASVGSFTLPATRQVQTLTRTTVNQGFVTNCVERGLHFCFRFHLQGSAREFPHLEKTRFREREYVRTALLTPQEPQFQSHKRGFGPPRDVPVYCTSYSWLRPWQLLTGGAAGRPRAIMRGRLRVLLLPRN